MEFEKILLDLHAVLDRARKAVRDYEASLKLVNLQRQELDQLKSSLETQAEGMEAREQACQKVENLQKLHKDATDLYNASNLRLNEATEADRQLKRNMVEEHSKIDQKRQLLAQEAQNNEKQKKAIDNEVAKRVQTVLKGMGR